MKKRTFLPRYKGDWGIWKEATSPGPFKIGNRIYYVNKEGKFTKARVCDSMKEIKSNMMTKMAFKKMFEHLLFQTTGHGKVISKNN